MDGTLLHSMLTSPRILLASNPYQGLLFEVTTIGEKCITTITMHGITVYREPSTDASYLTQINSAGKPAVNALNDKHFTST